MLIRSHAGALSVIVLLALLAMAADMSWPLVSKRLVDLLLDARLGFDEKLRTLLVACFSMVGLFVAASLLNLWRAIRTQLLTSKVAFSLRRRMFERILRLSLAEVNDMKTGGVVSRLSHDVDNATGLLWQAFLSPLLAGLRLVVTIVIVFTLNWKIALVALFSVPPILLIHHVWIRKIRAVWRSVSQDRQEIDARVGEALGGLRIVRAFGGERREELAHAVGNHTIIRKQMLATRAQRMVALVWDVVMPFTQVAVMGAGGYLVLRGQTSVGTLVAFHGFIWRMLEPVMQLAGSIGETQRGLAALDRVHEVLEKEPEKKDLPDALDAPRRVEEIRFEHVGFAYRPNEPVIHDFDLRVPGGSIVALVGPSGAGKTTVTDLVARFHDPTHGRITLNGRDVRTLRVESYRSLFGIVQQDVFLFDGTVRENIAYGRRNAGEDEVRNAAVRANAHAFIERLPEGYDTLVGERGLKLSGGQRQRLSIARALLADPVILVLDEATSSLDSESERLIQEGLAELLRHRTTFVIAHRLSTIRNATQIVVMDHGRILEHGTHAELMRARGVYRAMVDLQDGAERGSSEPVDWLPSSAA